MYQMTFSLLGISCGVNDLSAVAEAGYVCNELGLGTTSTGGTIACAMEPYENGILSEEEVGYLRHL